MAGSSSTASGNGNGNGGSTEERLPMPSKNPLPLSASQEAQVRDIFYARVRSKCADEIKAFADCALGRTFSAPFLCRPPLHVMNSCMKSHATPAEQDAAREDWFAQRTQRARERERKGRRKAEQEAFLREWWGLPEKDRDEARREMEKLKRGERMGGFLGPNRRRIIERGVAVLDDEGERMIGKKNDGEGGGGAARR
ncbi:cytochrome c oxidase biogenesis protein Cmc1 like-domain-containing protein [Lasiosphaeria miniovina]|uniref:COX assembly mitochondrial protein n=1 Tax=Lasiosphaeria miniovina TaxID=1954250 RepID=A0AA40EB67_9PEZI|nr:cytochrome c oxidase biogenesis protein Cmc1 like-domain-containing protein [Lasiosphaeria miniovina]KAK0733535.1 cytochrome c oxidase biogenesis protein Cmc1 like-domain-containing protein [Lasiosphaeria miniovina]